MSRIGVLPIEIPSQVKVEVDGQRVAAEGPKGKLQMTVAEPIKPVMEGSQLKVQRPDNHDRSKSLHGLSRTLLNNLVTGVSQGFTRRLELNGVGFRASVEGNTLRMHLGYSHPSVYPIPEQVQVSVAENTKITIEGPDKEVVGRVAAEIRNLYPVEPYKAKGVRYAEEKVLRKEGKSVK